MARFRSRTFGDLSLASKVVVVIGALFVLVGFIMALVYASRPVDKPVEREIKIGERPSIIAFSKSELTTNSLTKMLNENFHLGRGIFQVKVTDYPAGQSPNEKLVVIVYDESPTSNEILKFRFYQNARLLIPILLLHPDVAEVSLQARVLVKDIHGSEEETPVIKILVKRSQARKINWGEIESEEIPKVVDSYWIHPSLKE